ncbi:hypothetical protein BAUCODRAFT_119786 [Baudoinia panamericana UAMH 10762]|uniref:Uncharacterized protein n=1 Tax=Baudoinia panamericana (strain UAMH 10762) TaxID=717646 RepID=M2LZU3_BAUPA|nr:uncharacterized protein BAUCODRAFT_119786 [Baudoinia panamericana UAMH 10762]EMD00238.1 hypothetical protein BAUCODRAFT_119786 [Baudoinia panamericana UAMH 10762]
MSAKLRFDKPTMALCPDEEAINTRDTLSVVEWSQDRGFCRYCQSQLIQYPVCPLSAWADGTFWEQAVRLRIFSKDLVRRQLLRLARAAMQRSPEHTPHPLLAVRERL